MVKPHYQSLRCWEPVWGKPKRYIVQLVNGNLTRQHQHTNGATSEHSTAKMVKWSSYVNTARGGGSKDAGEEQDHVAKQTQ